MEWTKIHTSLIVNRVPDKEILAITKYQLLWAELEHEPDEATALRYMTANQLALARQYLDSIMADVCGDIEQTHRGRNRRRKNYIKNKENLKNVTCTQTRTVTGSVTSTVRSQIREDKIREDIRKEKRKENQQLTAVQSPADPKPIKDSLPKDPNEGTFRAGGKTKPQKLACWWVKNYYPQLYATAGKKSTESWFKRYGKPLNEILNLADGSLPLAVASILATQEQMRAFQKRKGEDVTWGLEAVSRNFTENFVRAQEIMQSGNLPKEVQNA